MLLHDNTKQLSPTLRHPSQDVTASQQFTTAWHIRVASLEHFTPLTRRRIPRFITACKIQAAPVHAFSASHPLSPIRAAALHTHFRHTSQHILNTTVITPAPGPALAPLHNTAKGKHSSLTM
ncbi:hypothetical protein E2C01_069001 [Portunus trituberculatus]|uniref:Uncharacterized protein n=1 Tax=Portunus trituberculatus TaxID=210409 RepID=A0A5B7HXG2_PORTR|nr:hypothetical protein [Portunus trituberculatus]